MWVPHVLRMCAQDCIPDESGGCCYDQVHLCQLPSGGECPTALSPSNEFLRLNRIKFLRWVEFDLECLEQQLLGTRNLLTTTFPQELVGAIQRQIRWNLIGDGYLCATRIAATMKRWAEVARARVLQRSPAEAEEPVEDGEPDIFGFL